MTQGSIYQVLDGAWGLDGGLDSLDAAFSPPEPPDSEKLCTGKDEMKLRLVSGLTATQRAFVEDMDTPLLGLIGGFGSGKTFSLCAKAVFNLLEMPGFDGMVVMGTMGEFDKFWDPNFLPMLETYGLTVLRYQKVPARIITVKVLGQISRINCFSGDKKGAIRGANVAWGLVDELDRYPYPDDTWKDSMARVRVGPHPQLSAGSTPEGYRFLFHTFAEEPNLSKPDRKYLSMSTYENEHNLAEGYIEKLKSSYAESEFDAYVNGRFVNLSAASVYDTFNREVHVKRFGCPRGALSTILVGMDFNITNCNAVLAYEHDGALWVFAEITGAYDTYDLCERITERQDDLMQRQGAPGPALGRIKAFPDASAGNRTTNAAETDIDILEQYGFLIGSGDSNPFVRDRVQAVRAGFRNARGMSSLWIHPSCSHLIECLERQAYDPTGTPDKKEGWDHMNDALGYLVYWRQPVHAHPRRRPQPADGRRTPLITSFSR